MPFGIVRGVRAPAITAAISEQPSPTFSSARRHDRSVDTIGPAAGLFPLFGMPFLLIGAALLSAPLFAWWWARRTVYVITNLRAITFEGGRSSRIRSYRPETLTNIYRTERRDGSGDVVLARLTGHDKFGGWHEELGFLRVHDVKDVEWRLKALAERGTEAGSHPTPTLPGPPPPHCGDASLEVLGIDRSRGL